MWRPGIKKKIETLVCDCEPCLLITENQRKTAASLQVRYFPKDSWNTILMDICEEITVASKPQRYCLVAYDFFLKWLEVATADIMAIKVVTTILKGWFPR